MTSTATARGKTGKSEVARYQMLIDGKFVDATNGKTFDVYDPSTEGVIATCPAGGPEDVDRAARSMPPQPGHDLCRKDRGAA